MSQLMRVPMAKETVGNDRQQGKQRDQFNQQIGCVRHKVLRFSQDAQLSQEANEAGSYCIRWG